MHCLCLIGGMDIKNISLIFSRHRFTVQQKAKPNKPQTQKKFLLFIYGMGVCTVQNQTQGPQWYRGPPVLHRRQPGVARRLAGGQLQPKT